MNTENDLARTFKFNSGIYAGTYHTNDRTANLLTRLVREQDAGAAMVVMAMGLRAGIIIRSNS